VDVWDDDIAVQGKQSIDPTFEQFLGKNYGVAEVGLYTAVFLLNPRAKESVFATAEPCLPGYQAFLFPLFVIRF